MNFKKIIALLLTTAIFLPTTGCQKKEKDDISITIGTLLDKTADKTLLDEVLEENIEKQNLEVTYEEIVRVEEYIRLINQISNLNLPIPHNIPNEVIEEFTNMPIDQVYHNIEKQYLILGTGDEILKREYGLYFLKSHYQNWLQENALRVTKNLLQCAIKASTVLPNNSDSTYSIVGEPKIEYGENITISFDCNSQEDSYTIGENSGSVYDLVTSYASVERTMQTDNPTYEEIIDCCLTAYNAVKMFVVSEISIDDSNNITSDKISPETKKYVLKN